MFQFEQNLEHEIRALQKPKPTFIFPEYDDPRVLIAASRLLPLVQVMFPVNCDTLRELIQQHKLPLEMSIDEFLSRIVCVDLARQADYQALFGQELARLSQGKKWEINEKTGVELMAEPLNFSIMAVRQGFTEAILGGLVLASKDYFVPCLRILKKEATVFELGLFVLPDEHPTRIFKENIAVFSDVAINPAPDAEALANIAVGTCQIVRDIIPNSLLPQVNGAIISYSTKGSGGGPPVDLVRTAGELIPAKLQALGIRDKRYLSIHIDWELQISVALSEAAARKKIKSADRSPAAGNANVLIVSNLDFGNALYHLYATTWPHSLKMLQVGGIFGQALDFSRSSTAEDVVLAGKALCLQHLKRADFTGTKNCFE